jgi:hypothetical protein
VPCGTISNDRHVNLYIFVHIHKHIRRCVCVCVCVCACVCVYAYICTYACVCMHACLGPSQSVASAEAVLRACTVGCDVMWCGYMGCVRSRRCSRHRRASVWRVRASVCIVLPARMLAGYKAQDDGCLDRNARSQCVASKRTSAHLAVLRASALVLTWQCCEQAH